MELSRILDQSQPRVSRHLKLMTDAGLIERFPDGARVFYRLTSDAPARLLIDTILDGLEATAGDPDDHRACESRRRSHHAAGTIADRAGRNGQARAARRRCRRCDCDTAGLAGRAHGRGIAGAAQAALGARDPTAAGSDRLHRNVRRVHARRSSGVHELGARSRLRRTRSTTEHRRAAALRLSVMAQVSAAVLGVRQPGRELVPRASAAV